MTDTPEKGETGVEPSKNDASATVAPTQTVNTVDNNAEVERLKKEAEKAIIRANQLSNELKKRDEAAEAAKLKQLEENEEWKSLAEQERAKREALEAEKEAEKRQSELKTATSQVLSQFPAEVVELAEEMGLSLTDTSDEAQIAFKEKLEKVQAKVVKDAKVTPNNPQALPTKVSDEELLKRMGNGDKEARHQVISNLPGVQEMRKMAGFSE